jgi:hypothetical protein
MAEWEDAPVKSSQWEDAPQSKPLPTLFSDVPSKEKSLAEARGGAYAARGLTSSLFGLGGALEYFTPEAKDPKLRGAETALPSPESIRSMYSKMGFPEPKTEVEKAAQFGGEVAPVLPALSELAKKGYKGVTGLFDTTGKAEKKAAKIATEALGSNLEQARTILKQASDDLTASEALAVLDPKTGRAKLTAPTAQALLQRAQARDPEFFMKFLGDKDYKRLKELYDIAGGTNQTAAMEARAQLKKELNDTLIPKLEIEINAVNEAGEKTAKYATEAERMKAAAASKVEDVRRFTTAGDKETTAKYKSNKPFVAEDTMPPTAGERASLRAPLWSPSYMGKDRSGMPAPFRELPTQFGKYTYMGDLAQRAELVAASAAEGSLRFGEAAKFNEAALQSLEAHGLKPLTSDSIIAQINKKLADPKIGPNEYVAKSLNKIKESLKEWTNNKGVIDAWALDNIRKNTNHMVETLMPPGTDPATVKKVAGLVTEQVRPLLIDAVEAAGGTGYRKYLEDYSKGMQSIGQSKLGAEMLRLYQTSPEEFVKFVEGNKPQEIEKIFGTGSYNIFKEMSANTQSRLGEISTAIKREGVIKEQAAAGQRRLQDILEGSVGWWKKIPLLSGGIKGRTAAEIVTSLEKRVDKRTMDALTEAAKSAKSFDDLLSKLPQEAKSDAMQALISMSAQTGVVSGTQEKKKQPLSSVSPSFER